MYRKSIEQFKNKAMRPRIRILSYVALIFMTILMGIGLMTASTVGKVALIIFYIVGIYCGLTASRIIVISIIEELYDVRDVVKEIADGNLNVKIPDKMRTKDEFGEVVENMGITLERLSTYTAYIDEITESLNTIASGQLKIKLKQDYSGEFAKVKQALEQISLSLSTTMDQINETAESVTADTESLSLTASSLSDGASNQASAIEELNASLTTITEMVHNNSQGAVEATHKVIDMLEFVKSSDARMEDLRQAMEAIKESSDQIVNIMSVIQGIATQTNLLSLNAAIEAARAGEQGKGFAVVATEVGNLANQSVESAKNTAVIVQQTMDAVEKGVAITKDTAAAMQQVVEGTSEISDIMHSIAEASTSQSDALSQISEGVDQIAEVVDHNVASASDSAETSARLEIEVQKLMKLVEQFK